MDVWKRRIFGWITAAPLSSQGQHSTVKVAVWARKGLHGFWAEESVAPSIGVTTRLTVFELVGGVSSPIGVSACKATQAFSLDGSHPWWKPTVTQYLPAFTQLMVRVVEQKSRQTDELRSDIVYRCEELLQLSSCRRMSAYHWHRQGGESVLMDAQAEPCACSTSPLRRLVSISAWLSFGLSGPQGRDSRDLWAQKVGRVSRRRIDVLRCGCVKAQRPPAERRVDVSQPMLLFAQGRWKKSQKDPLEKDPAWTFLMFKKQLASVLWSNNDRNV